MTGSFSALRRKQIIQELSCKTFDLLIIGGGITGAGIALDAANRGIKTALIDMQDFSAGTSSRSTKLVHGGLRYLKQYEFKIVAEVGKEREIVYENGPHVTTPVSMLLPLYKGGSYGKFLTNIGLRIYDFLAGVKKEERRTMLSVKDTLEKEPMIRRELLLGSGCYVEYRTDDARLTIEVLKEAVKQGATATNYVKAEQFIYEKKKINGIEARDQLTGEKFLINARKVVNATGPWVDEIRSKDNGIKDKSLLHTKGVHLVFDQNVFPLKHAIYYDNPDGRMLFAIPREGKTYVGTTDTEYHEDLKSPTTSKEDIDYILNSISYMFPSLNISHRDVESSWAGIRPLIHEIGKPPSEISRKDEIFTSPSGLISIAGGKLTGYRKMAEEIVDSVIKELTGNFTPCQTVNLPISGGHVGGSKGYQTFKEEKIKDGTSAGLTLKESSSLINRYGSNVGKLFDTIKNNTNTVLPAVAFAELVYSIEEEMVQKPTDFLFRRTGALLFNIEWTLKWKNDIINLMSDFFKWTKEEKERYTQELEEEIYKSTPFL